MHEIFILTLFFTLINLIEISVAKMGRHIQGELYKHNATIHATSTALTELQSQLVNAVVPQSLACLVIQRFLCRLSQSTAVPEGPMLTFNLWCHCTVNGSLRPLLSCLGEQEHGNVCEGLHRGKRCTHLHQSEADLITALL